MLAETTRPVRRELYRAFGYPDSAATLAQALAHLRVGLGPRRIRVIENAILVPGGGILDGNGETLPDGWHRRGPTSTMSLGQERIEPVEPTAEIDGEALFLGWSFFMHFGHFLIEGMARWWATSHVPADMPLLWLGRRPDKPIEKAREHLAAFGIAPDRASLVHEPTRVRHLLVPDVTFEEHGYIHEDTAAPYHEIADRLCGPSQPTEQPLYLSRARIASPGRRIVHEALFEEFLSGQGWRVIHPEMLKVEEQIRAVRSHRHIAGHVGSAFHLANFTDHRPALHMFQYHGPRLNYLLWADPVETPVTALLCDTLIGGEDRDTMRLVTCDMAAAVEYLHAEGLVSTPDPPVPG